MSPNLHKEFSPIFVHDKDSDIGHLEYIHNKLEFVKFSFPGVLSKKRSELQAAYIEQFMDKSKPLPDVPFLEEVRHLDETTRAYDKAHKRNHDFWKKKSREDIRILLGEQ